MAFFLSRTLLCLNMDSGDNGHRCIHQIWREAEISPHCRLPWHRYSSAGSLHQNTVPFQTCARGWNLGGFPWSLFFFSSDVMVTHRPFNNEHSGNHLYLQVIIPGPRGFKAFNLRWQSNIRTVVFLKHSTCLLIMIGQRDEQ